MKIGLTKQDQLKKNKPKNRQVRGGLRKKPPKDLTEAQKFKYFEWIKQNHTCMVCGKYPEIHHVTHKSIKGVRRLHTRVVPLCFNHHSAQSSLISIHGSPIKFYKELIGLIYLKLFASNLYKEYQNETQRNLKNT